MISGNNVYQSRIYLEKMFTYQNWDYQGQRGYREEIEGVTNPPLLKEKFRPRNLHDKDEERHDMNGRKTKMKYTSSKR